MRDEFRAPVQGDVTRNSVLGEYVHDEDKGELGRGDSNICWNEYALLGEVVDDY